jgi:hypothetical protein
MVPTRDRTIAPLVQQGKAKASLALAFRFVRRILMPKVPFVAAQFVPTQWNTAEAKAKFGNTYLHFVDSEFQRSLFTKQFYNQLSNCFFHVAHYNLHGFYEVWFTGLANRLRFLEHTLEFPCYGDPAYTFSDVEREIQREVRRRNYVERYELQVAEERQAIELALLKQLEAKYRMPASLPHCFSPAEGPSVDVANEPGVLPAQASLF